MEIRKLLPGDEEEVSAMIRRTIKEVNTEDPQWECDWLLDRYSPEYIREMADECHTYVICENGKVVGTGTIRENPEVTDQKQSEIIACFIHPEYIGRGLGRMLFDTLESDELYTSAQRVWLTSSVMAQGFYEHRGYRNPYGHGGRNADTLLEYERIKPAGI